MSRIQFRGSAVVIRVIAISALVGGVAAGAFLGNGGSNDPYSSAEELSNVNASQELSATKAKAMVEQQQAAYTQTGVQAQSKATQIQVAIDSRVEVAEKRASRSLQRATAKKKIIAKKAARESASESAESVSSNPRPTIPANCSDYSGNRAIGCALLDDYGFSPSTQMNCLDKLWTAESGWTTRSKNKSSGAYGIPQAYPGKKMASAGKDWATNPATQIKWGLGYIKKRYKTPCKAWDYFDRNNTY